MVGFKTANCIAYADEFTWKMLRDTEFWYEATSWLYDSYWGGGTVVIQEEILIRLMEGAKLLIASCSNSVLPISCYWIRTAIVDKGCGTIFAKWRQSSSGAKCSRRRIYEPLICGSSQRVAFFGIIVINRLQWRRDRCVGSWRAFRNHRWKV